MRHAAVPSRADRHDRHASPAFRRRATARDDDARRRRASRRDMRRLNPPLSSWGSVTDDARSTSGRRGGGTRHLDPARAPLLLVGRLAQHPRAERRAAHDERVRVGCLARELRLGGRGVGREQQHGDSLVRLAQPLAVAWRGDDVVRAGERLEHLRPVAKRCAAARPHRRARASVLSALPLCCKDAMHTPRTTFCVCVWWSHACTNTHPLTTTRVDPFLPAVAL